MSQAARDPYSVLGVAQGVSDIELRVAYRAMVKRHHPDHNGGSPEAAAQFAQVQEAYAAIIRRRRALQRRRGIGWQQAAYQAVAAQRPHPATGPSEHRAPPQPQSPAAARASTPPPRQPADPFGARSHSVQGKRDFAHRLADLFSRDGD